MAFYLLLYHKFSDIYIKKIFFAIYSNHTKLQGQSIYHESKNQSSGSNFKELVYGDMYDANCSKLLNFFSNYTDTYVF